jgi:hypothetical protein
MPLPFEILGLDCLGCRATLDALVCTVFYDAGQDPALTFLGKGMADRQSP